MNNDILKQHKISEYEYKLICDYIGREPNINEIGVFSAMWSEHCGYKNTKLLLKNLPTKGKRVVFGPGENAGVIDIGDGDFIVFKIESHNHPSSVEPYQGAATGVGGILRDVFTMGARPIAILDSLKFGDPSLSRTKHLVDGVVRGIGDYGNCVGIPNVGGDTFFEDIYNQNILVNAMCVGYARKKKIVTSKATGIGNVLVYYGATTGRDGVHGASFASAKLDDEGPRSAIQVGNPFLEKLLLEATLELIEKDLIIAAQDMGAAGLTSASTEMATKGNLGVVLNLDSIPKRVSDITPYEMLLSESQERMLALINPSNWEKVKKILEKWDLNGVIVGELIEEKVFKVTYNKEVVVNLPLDSIVEKVPLYKREVLPKPSYFSKLEPLPDNFYSISIKDALIKMLSSPNIASKKWIYQQYDHMIGDSTVVKPGEGVGVIRVFSGSKFKNFINKIFCKGEKGIALTTTANPRYCYLDPEKGAMIAVAEAARDVISVGAEPVAITNCLNFGNPEDLDVYYQLYYTIEGMKKACTVLNTPVTGGNASLYNEGELGSIYPTPVIGMVGLIKDVSKVVKPDFKKDTIIILLGKKTERIDGSEFAKLFFNKLGNKCPDIDLDYEKKVQELVLEIINKGFVTSVDSVNLGGVGISFIKGCIRGNVGGKLRLKGNIATLFGETQSCFIVGAKANKVEKIKRLAIKNGVDFEIIGNISEDKKIEICLVNENNENREFFNLDELKNIYENGFENAIK
ncbi:MAG TPA: phosphoribosylformylglycinamidine synthase subunit PurL [Spirochaetota bacterium]|nr:phosphoribosylformylglycinamidine synthase subunit PurL [Spirochaetota bacterium]HOM38027.1 phosphoribosylformylglycinamidine synthase subunit PurL [Spirochaetota bacterium]HPQ48831.1 phosphoribosylformylglycinamidine synthase subunit PurL [Spirochaetota bacterium]